MRKMIKPYEIGICSWSFRKAKPAEVGAAMGRLGLRLMHVALAPIQRLPQKEYLAAMAELRGTPLGVSAGMIAFAGEDYSSLATIRATGGLVPDALAEERVAFALSCGASANSLGLSLVSLHAGFIPSRQNDAPGFEKLLERIGMVADIFAKLKLQLLFETGQETATDLAAFLGALGRGNVGVNFDPANMVLYEKGDPAEAVRILSPWIRHVHAKDAKRHEPPPGDAEAWLGKECPLGEGDAKLREVIAALKEIGYAGPLVIEREAGGEHEADVKAGIDFLRAQVK